MSRTHTVVSGDTLSGIAASYLGSPGRWPEIAAANANVYNPNMIRVGQVLQIPDGDEHHEAAASLAADAAGPEGAALVLRLPAGWFVSSRWGWREFAGYRRHLHTGHDIAGPPAGAPIVLGVAVRVHTSGFNEGGYGYYVVVETVDGGRWLLGHLHASGPVAGAALEAGQTLGLVGSTGASTGPHIHLESWAPGAADWQGARDPEGLYRIETA